MPIESFKIGLHALAAGGNCGLLGAFLWRWIWRRQILLSVVAPEVLSVAVALVQEAEAHWGGLGAVAAFHRHYAAFDMVQGGLMMLVAAGAAGAVAQDQLRWHRAVSCCYLTFVLVLLGEYAMADFWFELRPLANQLFWWRESLDVFNVWLLTVAYMLRPGSREEARAWASGDDAYEHDSGTEGPAGGVAG